MAELSYHQEGIFTKLSWQILPVKDGEKNV